MIKAGRLTSCDGSMRLENDGTLTPVVTIQGLPFGTWYRCKIVLTPWQCLAARHSARRAKAFVVDADEKLTALLDSNHQCGAADV
jgi:hypothetical protein